MSRAKMGRIYRVINKARKFGSALQYNIVRVEDETGAKEEMLAFTDDELKNARERMQANAEDRIKAGWLEDLLD